MWLNPQKTAGLVTFTKEILSGKVFCAVQDLHWTYITSSEHVGDMYAQSRVFCPKEKSFIFNSLPETQIYSEFN